MKRLGTAIIVLGAVLLAWIAVMLLWKEPATALYTHREQAKLQRQLDDSVAEVSAKPRLVPASKPRVPTMRRPPEGKPMGVIEIPEIDVKAVVIEGTEADELRKGPGHYPETAMPGGGKIVAIAGHRTTFGAWFRHIDDLEHRDRIILRTPNARYVYRVAAYEIVDDSDWSIIDPRPGGEWLVLSACHPLYSAKQRYVVFAKLSETSYT
jgi:sortase A